MKWYLNKIALLSLLLIIGAKSSFAQVALKMGGNISTMTSDGDINTKSGFLMRFHMGAVMAPVRISDSWYFEPEILLSWKGQKYSNEFTVVNTSGTEFHRLTEYKNKFTYLEFPMMFQKGLYEKVSLEFGPYFSLRIGGKKRGKTTITQTFTDNSVSTEEFSENESYSSYPAGTFRRRPLESFDVGFNVGAQYHLKEGLNLGMRYNFGLIDISKDNYPVRGANINHESNQVVQLYVSYYLSD